MCARKDLRLPSDLVTGVLVLSASAGNKQISDVTGGGRTSDSAFWDLRPCPTFTQPLPSPLNHKAEARNNLG